MTSKEQLPALYDPEADRTISDRVVAFWSGTGPETENEGTPTLRRALTVDERSVLERRIAELTAALEPAPPARARELRAAIGSMLGGFPVMQRHDQAVAKALEHAYLWVVRAQPHWAVIEACERVREDEAGLNPGHCPTEPEFARVVKRRVASYRLKLQSAEALLRAKVEPVAPSRQLDAAEIEARLGRPIGSVDKPTRPTGPRPGYMARTLADLERRKLRREAATFGRAEMPF
jgi:hypothetical protein